MPSEDLALVAHLLRRAGFGASRDELERYAAKRYPEIVEDLLHPERFSEPQDDVLRRYYPELLYMDAYTTWIGRWIYRMVNTQRPLEEKMALFWHHVFAAGWGKSEHGPSAVIQIEAFRQMGLTDLRTILVGLSRDPMMIDWLDNNENHREEPNENYGRELLELFSMGVGNYTEQDVKMAARAFTGWTFVQPIPLYPYGHYAATFNYRADDHDDTAKSFLGETGRLNGEDIVDIIVRQPAAPRFIARHLYNFFVADEPQVPAWSETPPRDPEAIETLVTAFVESGADIRSVLRVLFNSDFFKNTRFQKVKSPIELVAGTIKLVGTHHSVEEGLTAFNTAAALMGQQLMNPQTVEGWHTGKEWVNGGTLNQRVNFAVDQVADVGKPGLRDLVGRLRAAGPTLTPEEFVDRCIELVGPLDVDAVTRDAYVRRAAIDGDLRFDTPEEQEKSSERIGRMLQYIVASKEYQFA